VTALSYLHVPQITHTTSRRPINNSPRAADQDPPLAGEVPRFVEEIQRICDRTELQSYLDTAHRVGVLGHAASDEDHEAMCDAGAVPEDPVEWAENILLVERAKTLLLEWR
jgi:hypothetical protein